MAVWITKMQSIAEWGTTQFRVLLLQHELTSAHDLAMLVRRGQRGHPDEAFILLPDLSFRLRFPGFFDIDERALPDSLRVIVGSTETLSNRFPELAAQLQERVLAEP